MKNLPIGVEKVSTFGKGFTLCPIPVIDTDLVRIPEGLEFY